MLMCAKGTEKVEENRIVLNNKMLPVVNGCNACVAPEPFYHADRIVDFHVLLYVLEGVIYVTEEETDYEVHAGELFFLKKGKHHFGKKEIAKGTRWYFVHFYFEEQEELQIFEAEEQTIEQGELLQSAVVLPKKLSHIENTEIVQKFMDMVEYFYSNDIYKKWYINMKLARLLTMIAFYGQTGTKTQNLSEQICDYLKEYVHTAFSAKELEKHFFLSYKHMAAVFKKEKGMTMQQYHTNLRMQEACKMLHSTLIPVGEISSRLGYTDMLYFSRCFHRFAGMSPTMYRKKAPDYY